MDILGDALKSSHLKTEGVRLDGEHGKRIMLLVQVEIVSQIVKYCVGIVINERFSNRTPRGHDI